MNAHRTKNALVAIFFKGNTHRLWQIINKSSLIHLTAAFQKLLHYGMWKKRSQFLEKLPLSHEQEQLLSDLNANGFVRVDSLLTEADFLNLKKYLAQKLAQLEKEKAQQTTHTKDFWIRLSDSDLSEGMSSANPIAEISLKPELLSLASHYLSQAAFLQSVLLTYSVPSEAPLKSSQLWHQDHDNHRMLKFFVYLSDVQTVENGPFTLIPRGASLRVKNSFFPRHISDEEVFKYVNPSEIIQLKGKQWSAFVCDTSRCYHMGSRVAAGHSRLMTTSIYLGLPSAYPGGNKSSISPLPGLNELQQMALIP